MNDSDNNLHYTALELAEIKSVAVLNTDENKSAETDTTAERTIVFVASDNSEDRAHEHVEISTFYLPTKNGGLVRVADLAESKNTAVDIPLLTDHNGWEVDKVIGSVRSANFENGKLVFTVGISKRKYAQDLMTLIDEGHLHNAFSIGWRSGAYAPDTKTYTDGEILEVSLVTRGCNRDAFVLDIKSANKPLNPNSRAAPPVASNPLKMNSEPIINQQGEKIMQNEDIKNTETATPATEAPAPDNAPETNQEPPTKGTPMNETTNHKQIAAAQVQAPTQKITVTSNAKAYLATEEAKGATEKIDLEPIKQQLETIGTYIGWRVEITTGSIDTENGLMSGAPSLTETVEGVDEDILVSEAIALVFRNQKALYDILMDTRKRAIANASNLTVMLTNINSVLTQVMN